MKYPLATETIPAAERGNLNKKILQLIQSGDLQGITATDIFHAYTGDGGLHGLSRNDYNSYYDYSEAKKSIENGQFYTDPKICEKIVACVPVSAQDLIADLTFGMGNFFNFLPVEQNLYGCELDPKSFKVAQLLYPEANLVQHDIRYYKPTVRFDIIFGNPPFNLRWKNGKGEEVASQLYFLQRAHEFLSPGGVLAVVMPSSFLADDFMDKNQIKQVNEMFSFLGQTSLPLGAFAQMGCKRFETKVMFLQKSFEGIPSRKYEPLSFTAFQPESIQKELVAPALKAKYDVRYKILFSGNEESGVNNWSFKNEKLRANDGFEFRLKKILFEIKQHPVSRKSLGKALELVQKFRTQEIPKDVSYEEWEKIKLTENKVLGQLKRTLRIALNPKRTKKGIEVVKNNHGLVVKAHDAESKSWLKTQEIKTSLPFYSLVDREAPFEGHPLKGLLAPFEKLIAKKRKLFHGQGIPAQENVPSKMISDAIAAFSFVHANGESFRLNKVQRNDVGLVSQKPFGAILNWSMGGGKSAADYCIQALRGREFRNTFIVAPPIAVNMTWIGFLERQKANFRLVETISDVASIQPGEIVLVTIRNVVKLRRQLKRYMRIIGHNGFLIFDESDEITNYQSKRSRAILSVFRKAAYKLLSTGTTTRNNVSEIYGQLELIHNNSYTFICDCPTVYKEMKSNDGEMLIREVSNPQVGKPFPARGGLQLFKSCYSPSKATVFGIKKTNQDIYNYRSLERILRSCVVTRKFKDIVGPGKYELYTHTVSQTSWEEEFYREILEEFQNLIPIYFSSTGNSRKDSMLRIIRQLRTLIKACSVPNVMLGNGLVPSKAETIVSMIKERDTRVMLGCTGKTAARFYCDLIGQEFPDRPVFLITGDTGNFKSRQAVIDKFKETANGILVSTQQSLSSSVNIPFCNEVILESMQWNLPKIEQYYFRTIRFDSTSKTNVHFVVYENSIEVNILALLMDKERINDFIKTFEFRTVDEMFGDYKLAVSFLDMLIEKVKEEDGHKIKWGKQKLVA